MNEVGKVQKVKSPFPKNTMGRGEDQGKLVDSCSTYRGQLISQLLWVIIRQEGRPGVARDLDFFVTDPT